MWYVLDIIGRTVLDVRRVTASAVNDWCVMQSLVARTTDALCAAKSRRVSTALRLRHRPGAPGSTMACLSRELA